MKKKILFFACIVMSMTAGGQTWDGTTSVWTEGKGTQTEPYLIETGANLAYLSEQVKAGETYEGVYFRLANDLDMGRDNQLKFSPIGFFDEYQDPENSEQMIDDSRYFLGVFDGNNKTIDNIHIYFIDSQNSVGGTGLFACISKEAEVKNLTIGANSVVEGTESTGSIVGAMTGGVVSDCENKASMTITEGFGQGGIVGSMYGGTVSGCVNSAMIGGSTNVGGIAGYVDRNGTVENCYNTGDVSFTGFYAGGIIGYLTNGTVRNCYSSGKVLNDWSGCAVIGTTDSGVTIDNCYYLAITGGATDDKNGVTEKTEEEMKSAEFIASIDNSQGVWTEDKAGINNGFPILKWQEGVITSVSRLTTPFENNITIDGNHVSVTCYNACRIIAMGLDGKTVATAYGNNIYLPASGVYVVTVYSGKHKDTIKVAIR